MKTFSKIYVDLDGVLADFDSAADRLFPNGRPTNKRKFWSTIASTENFFGNLEMLPGAERLWEAVKSYSPTVLTGVPMGGWAEKQKREWVKKHLGKNVKVITCFRREKINFAVEKNGNPNLLIDDNELTCSEWISKGGIAIRHSPSSVSKTIALFELLAKK